jgi:hypothetical protein
MLCEGVYRIDLAQDTDNWVVHFEEGNETTSFMKCREYFDKPRIC